jgi:YfiH family protein
VSFRAAGEHLAIDLPGGTALFTTRRGGVSEGPFASLNLGLWTDDDAATVDANRERVRAAAGAERLAQGRQVHGTRVVVDGQGIEDADGQATTARGVAAIVLVADCLPVALAGPERVGVVHAGWRGLAAGVLETGVAATGAVAAAIGPGIGPCCYEVGDEVRAIFGTSERTLDLKAIARERLRAAGVEMIHDCGLCTACDVERFFSHRRDHGVTGRQAGLAWRS